jgi:hypothetical protein
MYSPWGKIQSKTQIDANDGSESIMQVSTAGHGGLKLNRKQNAKIPAIFRRSGGWYEEDCEWAIVALFMPSHFNEDIRKLALQTVKDWFPDEYEKHFALVLSAEESSKKACRLFQFENKDNFVTRSAFGDWHQSVPKGMVGVVAEKESSGERKFFLVPQDEYQKRTGTFVIDTTKHQESTLT